MNAPLSMMQRAPVSRTRVERVSSTLLANDDGPIRCPRRLTLALDVGNCDPGKTMMRLLRECGFDDPQQLRASFDDFPPPMICCLNPAIRPRVVARSDSIDVLRDACLLGLCTAVFYDPARPVIWTSASLTRRVELFDTAGFYA